MEKKGANSLGMELSDLSKTTSTTHLGDETDDVTRSKETDPCLPTNNSTRRSFESLNKTRDNDPVNSSVLDSEKNKNNENVSSYKVKTDENKKGFKSVKFNPPPSKFEQWCSEKTGLSRIGLLILGVLLLLLFIMFIIVFIMSFLWPTIPHSLMFPMCRSFGCLLASSEIIMKMNQSVDACDDIRKYSCGHWLTTHTIPKDRSLWNIKEQMQYKHREHIRDMITTMAHPSDSEQLEWRLKTIFDSCMSVGSVETDGSLPLKKVITNLGGWHVLRDFSVQTWDMKQTLRNLHARYNIQPFFSVDVVPDPKSPQESIIQISPGKLGLPDKTYYKRKADDKVVLGYQTFLRDVVLNLGATSAAATSFSDDLFGFERRLAERFPSKLPDRVEHYRPTIAKLEEIAPSIPFFDILSGMFPDAKLNKKSEVVVVASDHLVNVSYIISTTDRSALNDYMMWRLTIGYLPYLSKQYRSTIFEFHRRLYGKREADPRWEVCVKTLQKFVGYGLEAISEATNPTEGERKRKLVGDIFEQIRTTIRDAIQTSNSLPRTIQEHFLDKLNSIGIQMGLPVSMRHPEYYNSYYRSLTSLKYDYFQNVIYGVNFLLEEQQRRLSAPSEEHRWMDIASDGQLNVVYVPEINKVIVPMALLSMPYFHTHYPVSVVYGGLGTELAVATMGSVSGRGLLHAGDGSLLPPDHPLFKDSHDCFLHQDSALTPHLEAIKYSYRALKNILTKLPHVHQPALEYLEDEAIFYITYAQSICTMRTAERQDVETTLKSKLDDNSLLESLMYKSKQFSTAFSCSYPLRKDLCDSLI